MRQPKVVVLTVIQVPDPKIILNRVNKTKAWWCNNALLLTCILWVELLESRDNPIKTKDKRISKLLMWVRIASRLKLRHSNRESSFSSIVVKDSYKTKIMKI